MYPGVGNLRDLGEQGPYATKFVQHSGPISLPLFYFNNKSSNVIEAIKMHKTNMVNLKENLFRLLKLLALILIQEIYLIKLLQK